MKSGRADRIKSYWRYILSLVLVLALWGVPTTLSAAPCTYTVQSGDTLGNIAAQNGITIGAILAANPEITNPNYIYPGQQLLLPECGTAAASTAPPPPSSNSRSAWAPPLQPVPAPPADLAAPLWQQAHDATVTIRHPIDSPTFSGSGIVVGQDGRTFLTAYHVIGNPMTGEEASEVAIGPFGNWQYTADVVASDPSLDLAILRVREPDFPGFTAAPLGSSMSLAPGAPIYTLSYPGIEGTLVTGKGSLLAEVITFHNRAPLLVTDASADFGSSGGVAVNESGEVIGIITAGIIGREGIESLGYTGTDRATLLVPIEAANALLEEAGVR
ncbi:MAG: trypsin-like peptidase domain-containing protein [Chloroflexota bacterium]|nr:trypsin-like peptidase domain-containing protein [Chloroflexota bacterium]